MDTVALQEHKTSGGVPAAPRPPEPAHIIRDDAEAIMVAKRLAASFEKDAAIRDRDRIWPVAELDAFSQSGLWSINVPRAFGGPEGSYATLSKVVEIISAADSSIEIQSVDSTPSVQRRIVNVQGIVSDDCIFPAY